MDHRRQRCKGGIDNHGDVTWHDDPKTMPSRRRGYTSYDQCRRYEHSEGWHILDTGGAVSYNGSVSIFTEEWYKIYDDLEEAGEIFDEL